MLKNRSVTDIFKTGSALYIVQVSNLIIPLITLPWLSTHLGVEQFGVFNLVLVSSAYFNLVIDFGFNLTGPRNIAVSEGNRQKQSEIFWHIIAVKFGITAILLALSLLIIFIAFFLQKDLTVKGVILGVLLGIFNAVLNPVWFFQGKGKLAIFSILNLVCRLLALPFLFLLVKNSESGNIAILIHFTPAIAASLICYIFIINNRWLSFVSINKIGIKSTIKESFSVFIATCLAGFYSSSHLLIIGSALGAASSGIYAVADKMVKALQALVTPISMAVYHLLVRMAADSNKNAKKFVVYTALVNIFIGLLFVIFLHYFSGLIIGKFFSSDYSEVISILMVTGWIPLFFGIHQLAYCILLSYHDEKIMAYFYAAALILGCPAIFIAMKFFGLFIGAFAILAVEFLFALFSGIRAWKHLGNKNETAVIKVENTEIAAL